MSRDGANGYEAVGKVVLALILIAVATLVNGLVLTRLWAWFVASTFGLQELGIAEAIGLALTARFVLSHYEPKVDKRPFGTLMTEAAVRIVIGNGFILLFGLAVVQFT